MQALLVIVLGAIQVMVALLEIAVPAILAAVLTDVTMDPGI